MRAFLMAIVRWLTPRRGLRGHMIKAIEVLDKAIVDARESHRRLSSIKYGVITPLRERDNALATMNALVEARATVARCAIMLVLVACGGGNDERVICGDGLCEPPETSSTCILDCQIPPACTTAPDSCAGDQICTSSGGCVAAFPRVYALTQISVSVPTTNPATGESWDVGGGAPDLYLGDQAGMPLTTAISDSFNALFSGPLEIQLDAAGATVRLDIWDEDATTPDPAFFCVWIIGASDLRRRRLECAGNGVAMNLAIDPRGQ